ncbi:hypothetical protein EON63_25235 [archaeon]|nr:MAG: hypothetical protein EON63_25235 [archaeon]
MHTVKRKITPSDYVDAYHDVLSANSEETDVEDVESIKIHHTNLDSYVMCLWQQSSPFVIILIILCLFMAGFVATHASVRSSDFHVFSDSLHDSHPLFTPRYLRSNLTLSLLIPSFPTSSHIHIPSSMEPNAKLTPNPPWAGCLVEIPPDPDRRHIVPPPPVWDACACMLSSYTCVMMCVNIYKYVNGGVYSLLKFIPTSSSSTYPHSITH